MTDGDHETWKCRRCGEHHPVPREPGEYRATAHFQQQYKFRDVPEGAIADCIKRGECKRDHTGEDSRRFEYSYGPDTWRVVVSLRPSAYHGDGIHRAVTICPVKES